MRLLITLFLSLVVSTAFAADDYSPLTVSKNEMHLQLEKMRKDGQISEQQLKDAKAAVGGLSDAEMKELNQKGMKQVEEGKLTLEHENLIQDQMQGIQDNIKKMEEMNEKE